jgi:hypothetical protein
MNKEADTNPMGRAGTIEEVCSTIIHLTSAFTKSIILFVKDFKPFFWQSLTLA